ncbi:MAG: translation factor GTPase family protein [Thermomicrobiales bacterium]
MEILNIGILAHVDAGKTSLTERILFETGVISSIGSVDKGTTQTDTMELERARGITIKSAVVSFQLGTLKVNLIDTPGHGDFVAEVERSLRVLDGVVLVVSAVEGVQSQTRRLAEAIRAAGLPMLIFVNKIDRVGARSDGVIDDIRHKLGLPVVAMNAASGLGDRDVRVITFDRDDPAWAEPVIDVLSETSERVIAEFDRTGGKLSGQFLEKEIRVQVADGRVVPAYFGSAMTGAGIHDVISGIEAWLPVADDPRDAPAAAAVFKIMRRASGEKIVYARVFGGCLAVRQQVKIQRRNRFDEVEVIEERITGVDRFADGTSSPADAVLAGDIAALHGLHSARIGDFIGDNEVEPEEMVAAFPAPALESVVRAVDSGQVMQLRTALEELAEQDPLISLRQRNDEGEISIRLFGEVQKEVMEETLLQEYGIRVTFGPSQTICIERPIGTGEHLELMGENGNPILATIGVRIAAGEPGSGIRYSVREMGSMPPAHYRAVEEAVYDALTQGLCGWEVTDCEVSLTEATVQYSSPLSTAEWKLTPLVVIQALAAAGTEVCEPVNGLELDVPEDTVGAVCGALIKARSDPDLRCRMAPSTASFARSRPPRSRPSSSSFRRLDPWRGRLEKSRFVRYMPVSGELPMRPPAPA